MSAKIISFVNSKGGVGKSSITANISAHLRLKKKRVLLIDMDSQGDSSFLLGFERGSADEAHVGHSLLNPENFKETLYDVEFKHKVGHKIRKKDMVVCPSSSKGMKEVVELLKNATAQEGRLRMCLDQVEDDYDYVLIDCPPDHGILTKNALTASDHYIVVTECEPLSAKNIEENTDLATDIIKYTNPKLRLLGVVFNKIEHLNIHNIILEEVKEVFNKACFKTKLPADVKVKEASYYQVPLCGYKEHTNANEAYISLTEEILKRINKGGF